MRRWKRRRIKQLRHFRSIVRKILRHSGKAVSPHRSAHRRRRYLSTGDKLLSFFHDRNFGKQAFARSGEEITVQIPEVFCFSENPDGTIELLRNIYYHGISESTKNMFFDHSQCKHLGISASTIMDVILLEIRKRKRMMRKKFRLSGAIPYEGAVTDILEASGLLKHLGIPEPPKNYIEKLELIRSGDSDYVSTQVTEYFSRCFATQKMKMSPDGLAKLNEMVGEVVNNCKLHSGDRGSWYTLGHYSLFKDKNYGECHLVIFNFGNTIYESLKSSETQPEVISSLTALASMHRGVFSRQWTEEALWTLYALQDGVSRFKSKLSPDRGTGTIRLIDRFQSIGGTKDGDRPIMSITSGRANIYFDGSYSLQPKLISGEQRKVIAFNKQNDLTIPPDPRCVRVLRNHFPGTVISMRFYLDREFLMQKNGGKLK